MNKRPLKCAGRIVIGGLALAFFLQMMMGFLGVPRWVGGWLSWDSLQLAVPPRYVVVLGGGGIPSESGLIRTYYAAKIGMTMTGTTFVVSLPCEGDPQTNSVGRMRDELVMRGIPSNSVVLEYASYNTHEQAVNIGLLLGEKALGDPVLLVTSPYHVKRALRCFRKQGFTQIAAVSAVDTEAEGDFGAQSMLGLRYVFWASLDAVLQYSREAAAMLYYRLRGWI